MGITCTLCDRETPDHHMTDHHLTPENRRDSDTTDLCEACHDQVHALFTNDELKQEYNTVTELRAAERLESYIDWISDTDKFNISVDESNAVRQKRN